MFENLPVEPDCEVYTADIPTMARRSIEDKANITHQNHNDNDGDQNTGHRHHYMLFLVSTRLRYSERAVLGP